MLKERNRPQLTYHRNTNNQHLSVADKSLYHMENLASYREIGHGHCGSVWTNQDEDGTLVIKREDGAPGRSIRKDAEMHQRIEISLASAKLPLMNIPTYHRLVDAKDIAFWSERLPKFPHDATHRYEACAALVSERIQPFAKAQRERLIDTYCAEDAKTKIKCSRPDEDCLVRPYLGRRTHNQRPSRFFCLRNRPLNVDQMENIDLPVQEYARAMADALATVFWGAKVDANDVEFVLAPTGTHPDSKTWPSQTLGDHTMWILDFDCCNTMSMDQAGIDQAAAAFFRNDPYYPRPGNYNDADIALWQCFRSRFLERSRAILGSDSALPQMMVDRLERLGEERRQAVRSCSKEQ